jgi:hypothetical protein
VLLLSGCLYFTFGTYFDGWIGYLRNGNSGALGPAMVLFVIGLAVSMALSAMLAAVLTRQALGLRVGGAAFYVSFGRIEWRTFGAVVRLVLFIALLAFTLSVLVGIIAGIVGIMTRAPDAAPVAGQVISSSVTLTITLLMIIGALAIFYVLVRTSFLLVPLVVAGDDPQPLRNSWTLGRDNFWRMFLVQLAVAGPIILLQELVGWLLEGPAPVIGGAPGSPENTIGELLAMQAQLPLSAALSAVSYLFIFPLLYAAQAFAYRALVPVPRDDSLYTYAAGSE